VRDLAIVLNLPTSQWPDAGPELLREVKRVSEGMTGAHNFLDGKRSEVAVEDVIEALRAAGVEIELFGAGLKWARRWSAAGPGPFQTEDVALWLQRMAPLERGEATVKARVIVRAGRDAGLWRWRGDAWVMTKFAEAQR
jgi:hypothetical protein